MQTELDVKRAKEYQALAYEQDVEAIELRRQLNEAVFDVLVKEDQVYYIAHSSQHNSVHSTPYLSQSMARSDLFALVRYDAVLALFRRLTILEKPTTEEYWWCSPLEVLDSRKDIWANDGDV